MVACVAWRFCRAGRGSGVAANFAREARVQVASVPISSRFFCPRPPLLLSAPNQNRHATQANPVGNATLCFPSDSGIILFTRYSTVIDPLQTQGAVGYSLSRHPLRNTYIDLREVFRQYEMRDQRKLAYSWNKVSIQRCCNGNTTQNIRSGMLSLLIG